MFFADPTRAFANLRTALRAGGRLAFACYRDRAENPMLMTSLPGGVRARAAAAEPGA